MDPTQEDLKAAGCWFDSEKAGSAGMTPFKRGARWRQHRWAVDELSIATFGTHPGPRTHPDIAADDIPNGIELNGSDRHSRAQSRRTRTNRRSPSTPRVRGGRLRGVRSGRQAD